MFYRSITKVSLAVALLLAAGCNIGPQQAASIGEAFVGPASLKIRGDIPLQSSVVAVVKHGDRLEILQRRRRFLKVRTPWGAEGWTDEHQLLAAADMAALRELAARAAKMPVQGQAITYSELNVHTQPSAQSPSFLQVKENEKMDVLTHVVAPRTDVPRKPLIPPPPKKAKAASKKPAKEAKYPPPPMPKPPPLPDNWLELSKSPHAEENPPEAAPADTAKPVPTDDWSLVRVASGQSGWVLTRRLAMAIPDDVAQYAEGRRIVSYFSLGEVADGDEKKHHWLWTTVESGSHPYDFDSFRVFIWSLRRHRYETAHIERNIRGYAPVLLKDVEISASARSAAAKERYPGFSICMEKKDGQRVRREYALLINVLRFAGERPCEASAPQEMAKGAPAPAATVAPPPEPPQKESFAGRIRKRFKAMTKGWFGG